MSQTASLQRITHEVKIKQGNHADLQSHAPLLPEPWHPRPRPSETHLCRLSVLAGQERGGQGQLCGAPEMLWVGSFSAETGKFQDGAPGREYSVTFPGA